MESSSRREQSGSGVSWAKRKCLAFAVSLQEQLRYAKAFLVGQARKLTARNEKQWTRAELQAEKMQVDAADEAERAKTKIYQPV